MNEQEQRLKKRIQIIVAGCLTLFFVLVTVLVFQFATLINQNNQENTLARQNDALTRQIQNARNDTAYFNSPQFREDFNLRYNNRGRPGDKVFF